jgi:hypothetical protein
MQALPPVSEPSTLAGPVLSYDVQQPAHADGQHYIQLMLAPSDFIASARAESAGKDGQPS